MKVVNVGFGVVCKNGNQARTFGIHRDKGQQQSQSVESLIGQIL